MFLRDLYTSVLRRWYFVLSGIIITAILATLVYSEVPVKYEATASVALIPPPTAVISGDNPFLYMGGLEQALGVLTVKLNSPAVRETIESSFPEASYSTARDSSTNGPIILISVSGASEADTLGTLQSVVSAVPTTLADLQDSLSLESSARISSMSLAQDETVTVTNGTRTRALLAVIAFGGAASLMLTGLLDRLLIRRGNRRASPTRSHPGRRGTKSRRDRTSTPKSPHAESDDAGKESQPHAPASSHSKQKESVGAKSN